MGGVVYKSISWVFFLQGEKAWGDKDTTALEVNL
jgi:hypothetical protein